MPTRRQHFVPRTYLSEWETTVEKKTEPENKFEGVYSFSGEETVGNGANVQSILWKQSLYTINFEQLFISQHCPLVYKDFVEKIFELMNTRSPQAVYGKLGYSIIKTKDSVRKHLKDVESWDFYYYDGSLARKKGIINDIHTLNSYILEDGFDSEFEQKWKNVLDEFISAMQNPQYGSEGDSVRVIPETIAKNILSFFFMMLCRNPQFDGMGIYSWVRDELLYPAFGEMSEPFMKGLWYTELYRMLFKTTGGHYHTFMDATMAQCQMILFEAYDNAGTFITSDNPAFQNRSPVVELQNNNGMVFPLSPKYLIFICRGSEGYNKVDYRMANADVVRYYNRATYSNRTDTVVANQKDLSLLI